MPEGLRRKLPNSMRGGIFAESRPESHSPAGCRLRFPRGVFILHQGIFLLPLIITSGSVGLRSGLSRRCCWEQLKPEVIKLLSSLQSHGQQEEGNCPAGKPQGELASGARLGLGGEEDGVEWKEMHKNDIICQQ